MILTTAGAVDEIVRLIAVYATTCDDVSPVVLLSCCQLCRNHLLYLLDTVPVNGDDLAILARLRALPEVHKAHDRPGHPDNRTPQIRWVLT